MTGRTCEDVHVELARVNSTVDLRKLGDFQKPSMVHMQSAVSISENSAASQCNEDREQWASHYDTQAAGSSLVPSQRLEPHH